MIKIFRLKQIEANERNNRKLDSKLKSLEYEKKSVESAQSNLEAELQRLRQYIIFLKS